MRSQKARTPKKKTRRTESRRATLTPATEFGAARMIHFERKNSDTLKVHIFGKSVRIYASKDRRHLIIGPVRIERGEIKG